MPNLLGRCTLPLVATSLTAASLCAQSASSNSALMLQQPLSQNCPVSLHAEHVPGGTLARAAGAKHPEGKPLRISFKPTDAGGVKKAELVLHGLSGTHVLPAGAPEGATSTEMFSVELTQAGDHRFNTVVVPQRLTVVYSLELKSMTFADGAVWHPSSDSTCRVAPDGYMLVAGGK